MRSKPSRAGLEPSETNFLQMSKVHTVFGICSPKPTPESSQSHGSVRGSVGLSVHSSTTLVQAGVSLNHQRLDKQSHVTVGESSDTVKVN